MERQAITTHKDSGIVNDANLWATETMGDAAYPLKLFQRVVTVSVETMKIVRALPRLSVAVGAPTEHTGPAIFEKSRSLSPLLGEDRMNFLAWMPDWVKEQKASDVFRLQMRLEQTLPSPEISEAVAKLVPKSVPLQLLPTLRVKDAPSPSYSVIGRFPSGATRTIGEISILDSGETVFSPFGYWSLLDPDDSSADPDSTNKIELQVDIMAIEVIK